MRENGGVGGGVKWEERKKEMWGPGEIVVKVELTSFDQSLPLTLLKHCHLSYLVRGTLPHPQNTIQFYFFFKFFIIIKKIFFFNLKLIKILLNFINFF